MASRCSRRTSLCVCRVGDEVSCGQLERERPVTGVYGVTPFGKTSLLNMFQNTEMVSRESFVVIRFTISLNCNNLDFEVIKRTNLDPYRCRVGIV